MSKLNQIANEALADGCTDCVIKGYDVLYPKTVYQLSQEGWTHSGTRPGMWKLCDKHKHNVLQPKDLSYGNH